MKVKLLKTISTIFTVIVVILSCILIAKNIFLFDILVVGDSMHSTLVDGEMGFATKENFIINIDREDIIIFEKEDKEIIKRVIGKPLDHVRITKDGVYINDELLNESYVSSENLDCTYLINSEYNDIVLGENEYYVLGDNRSVSYDSRYYGPISRDKITGKLQVITSSGSSGEDYLFNRKIIPFRFY